MPLLPRIQVLGQFFPSGAGEEPVLQDRWPMKELPALACLQESAVDC